MLKLLQTHFGYTQFRPLQREVIEQIMAGRDALVLMPTGGGKSLCFQLPALALPGLTIVISPLIALMKDQVDGLRSNGVAAAYINSSLSRERAAQVQAQARDGKLKLLYLAPERLAMPQVQAALRSLRVSLLAIDEAHCISEWGHDFRPDYRNLKSLRQLFPQTALIALTATANPRVRDDIIKQLGLHGGKLFQSSFNRPNLTYRVLPKQETFGRLLAELRARPGAATIIYCFSRKRCEQVAEKLRLHRLPALAYHAGMTAEARARAQDRFIRDEAPVIVATIAFGMGIDKPDVRLVVHLDLPKSVEGYYQETGRAGRDGLPSDCLLFFSPGDRIKHELFIQDIADPAERLRARTQLNEIIAYGLEKSCRRAFLLRYFGESWTKASCDGCDICLPMPEPALSSPERNPRRSPTAVQGPKNYDQALFEALRVRRRALAAERGVPPYVIFGDRSLQDMAARWPRTLHDMRMIFGVGDQKLADLGQVFLDVVMAHAAVHTGSEKK